MFSWREIIRMLGVGLFYLGLMSLGRGAWREQPFLKETGFTKMADAGVFEKESKILLLGGAGVWLISYVGIPCWGGKKGSDKHSKK